MKTCSIEDCDRSAYARGWCRPHYYRWFRHRNEQAVGHDQRVAKAADCSVEGCELAHIAKGYCAMHYNRVRRYGDPDVFRKRSNGSRLTWLEEAIHQETDDCILWPSSNGRDDYGVVTVDGRRRQAHVVALLLSGAEQTAPFALHQCDVRRCVNPRHLRWGTAKENIEDAYARGRRHCRCCPNNPINL